MTAFLFALSPFLLSTYAEDPEQEKAARGRTLTYLTFILALAGLTLTLFAKEIIEVLAPKFDDAYLAVGPLALGTALYGVATVLTTGLAIVRKTMHLAALGDCRGGPQHRPQLRADPALRDRRRRRGDGRRLRGARALVLLGHAAAIPDPLRAAQSGDDARGREPARPHRPGSVRTAGRVDRR